MQWTKLFRKWFPTPFEQTLREIERRLQYVPYVKVTAAAVGEPFEATIYHVTKVDRKDGYLNWFNPYNHANMGTKLSELSSISCTPDQDPNDLERHSFINSHIWSIHKSSRSGRGNKYRQRLGYDINNNPIYIRNGLHVHVGDSDERKRWGDVAPFLVAALEVDKGGPHVEAFAYYPGYGTLGFQVNVGGWEPCPRYIDYDQQARDRLMAEYKKFKAAEPFQEGDIVRSPRGEERIFIRYEDRDRTRMIVFPGDMVSGADKIAQYTLVERRSKAVLD